MTNSTNRTTFHRRFVQQLIRKHLILLANETNTERRTEKSDIMRKKYSFVYVFIPATSLCRFSSRSLFRLCLRAEHAKLSFNYCALFINESLCWCRCTDRQGLGKYLPSAHIEL